MPHIGVCFIESEIQVESDKNGKGKEDMMKMLFLS